MTVRRMAYVESQQLDDIVNYMHTHCDGAHVYGAFLCT